MTEKERKFCDIYAAQGFANATKAYLLAYGGGYNTANSAACKKLKKQEIKDYLAQLQKDAYEAAFITPERIAKELADVAFTDVDLREMSLANKLRALELLQKQFGLQMQKVQTEGETAININITGDDDK